MATGTIFTIIRNDGKSDRFLMCNDKGSWDGEAPCSPEKLTEVSTEVPRDLEKPVETPSFAEPTAETPEEIAARMNKRSEEAETRLREENMKRYMDERKSRTAAIATSAGIVKPLPMPPLVVDRKTQPRVTASIPTNLDYKITTVETSPSNRYDTLDTIIHTPSNAALVDKLTKEVSNLETAKLADMQLVKALSQSIKTNYETMMMFQFYKSVPREVNPIIDTKDLSDDVAKDLNDVNFVLSGDITFLDKRIAECKNAISFDRTRLVEATARLRTYDSNIVSLQSKLMTEQIKYMREMQNNPPKVLSDEEILNNHWANALREPDDPEYD